MERSHKVLDGSHLMPMSNAKGEMHVRKRRHHQVGGIVYLCGCAATAVTPSPIGSRKPAYPGLQQRAVLQGLGAGGCGEDDSGGGKRSMLGPTGRGGEGEGEKREVAGTVTALWESLTRCCREQLDCKPQKATSSIPIPRIYAPYKNTSNLLEKDR